MRYSERALKVKESSTLAISAKAKAMKAAGENVISFSIGEPDFDTPLHIVEAAKKALEDGFTKYTDSSGIPKLREAICSKLKKDNGLDYEPSQIVVSNGAKHSITNVCTAVLNPGDEVIIPAPYWLTYPEAVALAGGVPVIIMTDKANSYKATAEHIKAAVTPRTKALIINSPNNPSGSVYSEKELRTVAEVAEKHDLLIIADEIYEKLIYDQNLPHVSVASFSKDIYDRTVIINGLSKSYAMTGWRMGYTASPKELAKIMGNIQSHQTSNINSITQMASIAALNGDQSCVEEMRKEFAKRRDYMVERISRVKGFDMAPPSGAFYTFIDVSALFNNSKKLNITDAAVFAAELIAKKGVAVVPCADFGCGDFIRLSYAMSMDDIKEGMDRIEAFVKENW